MIQRWVNLPVLVAAVLLTASALVHAQLQVLPPVKVGVIQPLSGPAATSGNYVRMGAEIARDRLNARGGVLGGRRLELVIEDNKSDPTETASAAEKLIVGSKVRAIMGAGGDAMTLAAMPKIEERGVPMVVETSSGAPITTRGNPWVFRLSPPPEMEALGFEPHVGTLGVKSADFLVVNTDRGRSTATAFGDMLKQNGATVGVTEFMEPSATDMSAQLAKIKATGSDTLFLASGVEQIALAMKQAHEQRLARKIVTIGDGASPTHIVTRGGAAAEGTYHIVCSIPWFPEASPNPGIAREFVDEWTRRGHPGEGLMEGVRGHDGMTTIIAAIKLAGKDDARTIRDALWRVYFSGISGPINFVKDGPFGKESGQNRPSIFVVQIRDAKLAVPDFTAKK